MDGCSINIQRVHQKSEYIPKQLNHHLSDRPCLEFEHPTIADIAGFPDVALAQDSKINLNPYPRLIGSNNSLVTFQWQEYR